MTLKQCLLSLMEWGRLIVLFMMKVDLKVADQIMLSCVSVICNPRCNLILLVLNI